MATDEREPASLIPLTPAVFHILLALADGERHGYGIMVEVDQLTSGQIHLGPGTLYRSIQKMVLDGLIEETGQMANEDDERRRYYRLTAFGRNVAQEETRRLSILLDAATRRGLIGKRTEPGSTRVS